MHSLSLSHMNTHTHTHERTHAHAHTRRVLDGGMQGSLVVDLSKAGDSAADWHFVMLDPPRQCANAAGSEKGQEQEGQEQATRHAESSEQRKETRHAEAETEELKERDTRHAIAVVSSCAGGKAPAQLSVFRLLFINGLPLARALSLSLNRALTSQKGRWDVWYLWVCSGP
jgi:hypothetical protein